MYIRVCVCVTILFLFVNVRNYHFNNLAATKDMTVNYHKSCSKYECSEVVLSLSLTVLLASMLLFQS